MKRLGTWLLKKALQHGSGSKLGPLYMRGYLLLLNWRTRIFNYYTKKWFWES